MSNIVFIQARLGSTRLPGKTLLKLEDKTVLQHVINRAERAKLVDEVIVVTTFNKPDQEIVKLCSQLGIRIFCGSEDDVLDRFYQAAKLIKPKNIIRITADCPMIDPKIIDLIIKEHLNGGYDYTTNTLGIETYPDGEDVEIFTFESLQKAWENADLLSEREHVTPYIKKYPKKFKLHNVEYSKDLSKKRWTLDTQEDLNFIKKIFQAIYPENPNFSMEDVLDYLQKDGQYHESLNHHIGRNEGLKKSLQEDKIINK